MRGRLSRPGQRNANGESWHCIMRLPLCLPMYAYHSEVKNSTSAGFPPAEGTAMGKNTVGICNIWIAKRLFPTYNGILLLIPGTQARAERT